MIATLLALTACSPAATQATSPIPPPAPASATSLPLFTTASPAPTATAPSLETIGAAEVMARRGDPAYSTLLADAPNAAVRAVLFKDGPLLLTRTDCSGSKCLSKTQWKMR